VWLVNPLALIELFAHSRGGCEMHEGMREISYKISCEEKKIAPCPALQPGF
jgi:hypothetical protein